MDKATFIFGVLRVMQKEERKKVRAGRSNVREVALEMGC